VVAKQRELVGEERPVQQRHHRLGPREGEGTEPRPFSPGEDDGLGAG
jgi:hypothetical protein